VFNAIGPKALASNLFQFCVVMALFGIMEQYDYLKLKFVVPILRLPACLCGSVFG